MDANSSADARAVNVTEALSEYIGDSQSELAFTFGHTLGHIFQQRHGNGLMWGIDPESDADYWAVYLVLIAGYDPYGAAGALRKLAVGTYNSRLTTQFDNKMAAEVYTSINTRFSGIYNALSGACQLLASVGDVCGNYRGLVHGHLPSTAPLVAKLRGTTGATSRVAAPKPDRRLRLMQP